MIDWGEYLTMLKTDGVSLDSSEGDDVDETGNPIIVHFLWRRVDGHTLTFALSFKPSPQSRVPRYLQRQIANVLRLPPAKYIFRPL